MVDRNLDKYDSPILAKWGPDIAHGGYGSGWTAIPTAMIRNLGKLGLNGTDFAVLSIILSYWWDADTPPSPRVGGIAYMLDTSPRTVERTIKKLRKLRLIKQGPTYSTPTGLRRDFDLSSLVTKVSVLAENDLRHLAEVRRQREEKRRQAIAEELDDLDDFDDDVPY